MSALAALISSLLFSGFAIAPIVAPNCSPSLASDWVWSHNSLDQDPCVIAAYLGSTCNEGSYTIDPLMPGYVYHPPGSGSGSLCDCNTVTYSLLSACAACQGAENWPIWDAYSYNCTTRLSPSLFPNPVPFGTRVPFWASIDVTVEGTWNLTKSKAISIGDHLETPPGEFVGGSAATSHVPTGPTSSTSGSTGTAPTPKRPPTGKKANAGAIAGGVVAGVAAIAIAGAIFFCRRQIHVHVQFGSGSSVSGAPQAQFSGSPVDGESQMLSGPGVVQASSMISPINVTSQEPLERPSSAVSSALQPHMTEIWDSLPDYETIAPSSRVRPPAQLTSDTPNHPTTYPRSSKGAPSAPAVPSQ